MQAEQKAPLYENLRKLINIIDELRDVGLQQYIELPRIAVVGGQSAGKSSLLEAIVGLDFLPRGEGVVTRRPLELRLIHVPNGGTDFKPYAMFPEEGNDKYFDFTKVYDKIQELTDKLCGQDKGIIDKPITMKVYSQTAPDLTLIDLPGITRIAIGNQPKNIEQITKGMCRRYASNPRTIILCVMPANQDMSTSDALQLSQEEDPDGARTIGVITKIDIMDSGTNAKKMLLGQEIPLTLGFIGVKGRSQEDIKNKVAAKDAIKKEKAFFETHPVYSTLPPGYVGTEALSSKLTKVLFGHIRTTLPQIINEIKDRIKDCEDRLINLGQPLPNTTREKVQMLWNMIADLVEQLKTFLAGKYNPKRHQKIKLEDDLSGGAKIKYMFQQLYADSVDVNPADFITDDMVRKAMKLHQADSIPGFPSLDTFLFLLAPMIKKLRDPALNLLSDVHMYLENICGDIIDKVFYRFPSIVNDITELANEVLKEDRDIAKQLLDDMMTAESTYIFTNDVKYIKERTALLPLPEEKKVEPQQLQPGQKPMQQAVPQKPVIIDPERLLIDEMKIRLKEYYSLTLRNIRDSVPKIIGHFFVKSIQEKLQYHIYNGINRNEELLANIGEPPHISAERETVKGVLAVLNKAKKVLTKDPEFAPTFAPSNPQPNLNKPKTDDKKAPTQVSGSTISGSSNSGSVSGSGISGQTSGQSSIGGQPRQQQQQPQQVKSGVPSSNTSFDSKASTNTNNSGGNNPFSGFGTFNKEETKAQEQPKVQQQPNIGNAKINPNQGSGQMSYDDMKKTAQFVNDNKEDIKKAQQFANDNKEDIKKVGQFVNDNKEDIKKAADFANEHKEEIKKAGQFVADNKDTIKKGAVGAANLFGQVYNTVNNSQSSGTTTQEAPKKKGLFG